MKFGISDPDMSAIINIIANCDEIDKAILFGSRAKGSHKPGSDIDIAIYGTKIDFNVVSRLHALLEDSSPMPYLFDVVDGTNLTHFHLKEHIDRVGHIIYVRNSCNNE